MPAASRWQRIREDQWAEQALYRTWAARCRVVYRAGITSLWTGVAVAVVPATSMSAARAAAAVVAVGAAVGEVVWTLAVRVRSHQGLGRIPGLARAAGWLDRPAGATPTPPPERWPGPPPERPAERELP